MHYYYLKSYHIVEYGPATGKSHPDDSYSVRGWKTFPGTTFEEE